MNSQQRINNALSESDIETTIYDATPKGSPRLLDIGIRHNRNQANELADGWRESAVELFGEPAVVRVFHRRIKVDRVSYPVYMVVARAKKKG